MGFGGGVEQFAEHRREERVLRQRERPVQKPWGGNTFMGGVARGPVKREMTSKTHLVGPGGGEKGNWSLRGKGNQCLDPLPVVRLPPGGPVKNRQGDGGVRPSSNLPSGPHRPSQKLWQPELGCPWSNHRPPVFLCQCPPRPNGDKVTPDSPRAWTPCSVLWVLSAHVIPAKPTGAGATSVSTSQRGKLRLREGSTCRVSSHQGYLSGETGPHQGPAQSARTQVQVLPVHISPVLQLREASKNSTNLFFKLSLADAGVHWRFFFFFFFFRAKFHAVCLHTPKLSPPT